MAIRETTVDAPAQAVFDVLLDPDAYEHWVVGNRAVRAVDADWPRVGSRFHHNVGLGPLNTSDSTTIVELDAPRRLVLRARAMPVGVARVEVTVDPAGDGRSRLRLAERPVEGPMARVHNPVFDLVIGLRNDECLRRLRRLAEQRAGARA